MVYISQERGDGFLVLQNPNFRLDLNRNQNLAYFVTGRGSKQKKLATYKSIQRGREVLEIIKSQHNENPDSVFVFPED